MIVAKRVKEIRAAVADARQRGENIALVPTMGALHDGHFSLIRHARAKCSFTVVSIFVNPLQFVGGEDLETYPRTPDADLSACEARGVAAVFMPDADEMYKKPCLTEVSVPALSDRLCGAGRPGHFTGVCTVVAKLLNIVQPDRAVFGQKDYQQWVVLKRMVKDLNVPVKMMVCPTVREADGLAMSSRNAYLTPAERAQAPALWAALQHAEQLIHAEQPPAGQVVEAVRAYLSEHAPDAHVEYIDVVDRDDVSAADATDRPVLVALAVRLGKARLIDNLPVEPARPAPGSRR